MSMTFATDFDKLPLHFMGITAFSSKTVVVGMSGGVDSSVTAALLREQGYRVIGLFMKNWEEKDENGVCTSEKDFKDVVKVCERLDVPYYSVNFVKEYWENVFEEFLRDYRAGYTPNPDVLCNREIKFNVFLKKARALGADYLATGHYARNPIVEGERCLSKGSDPLKDQSYFLYALKQNILDQVLFPVGGIEKTEVRALARKYDLATQAKKDSTGICFIGERHFTKFLKQYVQARPGEFRQLDGRVVGTHAGCAYYTLGQRRGLGLGGPGDAWYVVGKDISRNVVFVERGEFHPALYSDYLIATEISWVGDKAPANTVFHCRAKTRYRQADQDCNIFFLEDGRLRVDFARPQRSLTPRQSVVFYQGDLCLGGAIIESHGPTYHERGEPLPSLNESNA